MKLLNKGQSVRTASANSTRKNWLVPALTVFLSVVLVSTATAQVKRKEDKESDRKTKETVAMSQPVYEALTEIQELVEADQYSEALVAIKKVQEKKKLSPYESAQIWNLTAYTYYLMEDYKGAIVAYKQVLAQPDLPLALQQSTLKTLAQLHFTVEDFGKALEIINQLIAMLDEPAADVYMLKGQAYFLLLRVIYWEMKDFPNMLIILQELVEEYPKDSYVLTLAGVYSELGDTKKQLALTEALYDAGYIDGKTHAVNLANLYLLHGIPYKAAFVLQKEIDAGNVKADVRNLRLLSQAWYQARNDKKSIPPLVQAAAMGEDGELYMRLAQSYLNLEMWGKAAQAAKKGIEVGNLKRKDTANIMYGMALFNQRKLEQARRAFQVAGKDNRSKRAAGQWIKYVDSEILRRDTLEQKLPDLKPRDIDEILKANADAVDDAG